MKKVYIDVEGVSSEGADIKPGTVIEVSELSYKALLREGKGRKVGADGEPVGEAGAASSDDEDETPTAPAAGNDAAEVEKQRKAINDQYNLDTGGSKPSLREAALAAGVEFAFDATKEKLIEAVLAQGKAGQLIL